MKKQRKHYTPEDFAEQERIAYLEKKSPTKDEVLAELMAECVAPKKLRPPYLTEYSDFTILIPAHDR